MPADGLPVLIAETRPPFGVLVYGGIDRPFPRVSVPTRLRRQQTWLPGNDVAVTHVLGIEHGDVDLEFRLHNDRARAIGAGPEFQVKQAQAMITRRNPALLIWGTTIVRRGFLVDVDPRFVRDKDIPFRLTFQVDEALDVPGALITTFGGGQGLQNLREAVDLGAAVLRTGLGVGNAAARALGVGV